MHPPIQCMQLVDHKFIINDELMFIYDKFIIELNNSLNISFMINL